jgi:hypothetical protein
MRFTKCLLVVPMAMALSVGSIDAKDKAKAKEEKDWKRSTEGHRPQDLNGDGVITRNEWPGNDESFRQADTDRDGVLTNKDRGYGAQGGDTRMYDRPVNDYKAKKRK